MENAEHLIRIDGAQRQIVVGVAAIVEMESAQHVLVEQPGHDLFDVLGLVVMPGVHQNDRLRAGIFGKQKRHAPVGNVGVIERGLKWLVFDQQALVAASALR